MVLTSRSPQRRSWRAFRGSTGTRIRPPEGMKVAGQSIRFIPLDYSAGGFQSLPCPPMTARPLALAAALALAAGGSGCGSGGDDDAIRNAGPNPNDKRGVAFGCVTREKQLDARLVGDKSIQVGGPDGPRIEFFVSSGEAEAKQFQGEAQGAEQVGAALLFVNQGSDEVLEKLEDCLAKQ